VLAVCALQGTEQYKAPEVYKFNNKGSSNAQNGSNAAHGNNNAQDRQHSGQNNPNKPRYASAPVDVWSAGVLLYAALNRVYPFNTRKDMNEEDVNRNLRGPRPLKYHQVLSHDCVDLIESMLAPQAADRITLPQIMQHRFFLQDISLQDPNLLHLTQLCFKEPSPCALSEQQLKDVIAEVHACLCLRRHTFS
jgi:serine/threonine protein kinase